MTKQKHLKRRIRERMEKTGESYTTARLHLLGTRPSLPEPVPADPGVPMRVRFRTRQRSRRKLRPLGLRYVAPAFAIVLALVIGAGGFLVLTAPEPVSASVPSTTGRGS